MLMRGDDANASALWAAVATLACTLGALARPPGA